MNFSKTIAAFLILVGGVIAYGTWSMFTQPQELAPLIQWTHRVQGNPEAPVKVIEFADFQCQECARGTKLLTRYQESFNKDLYHEYRYFPHNLPNAMTSALYAECAGRQGRFWKYHTNLFKKQYQWRTLDKASLFLDVLARDINLDMSQLHSCIKDASVKEAIQMEQAEAMAKGVRSTPTYFINKKMVVGVEGLEEELIKLFGKF